MHARYPTQASLIPKDTRQRCVWFYTNGMKIIADRNDQTIKIRKIRGGQHYVEITS